MDRIASRPSDIIGADRNHRWWSSLRFAGTMDPRYVMRNPDLGTRAKTIRDLSRFNQPFMMNNPATDLFVLTQGGYALDCGGTGGSPGRLETSSGYGARITGQKLTVVSYVQFDAWTAAVTGGILWNEGSGGGGDPAYGLRKQGSGQIRASVYTGTATSVTVTPTTSVNNTNVFQVGMTYDGANIRIWVDATDEGNTAKTGNISYALSGQFAVGAIDVSGTLPFNGKILDLRIYEAVWSRGDFLADLRNPWAAYATLKDRAWFSKAGAAATGLAFPVVSGRTRGIFRPRSPVRGVVA